MHDLDTRRHIAVGCEFALEHRLVTNEEDADALLRGGNGARHGNLRSLVAAHRVKRDDGVTG